MSSITQYILNKGIPEDIFIFILAIPIIFVVINFARRIIGLRTFGIYIPTALIILLSVISIKYGAILFALLFISMVIICYFLKKIPLLSLTDIRVLDTIAFCVVILVIILVFIYVPFFKNSLNVITLLAIVIISLYSESLLIVLEAKRFKRFISPAIESFALIIVSYFLINWELIQNIILKYPLGVILVSLLIIILLAKWRGLKIIEYLEFRKVIKHVELPQKK